MIALRGLCAVVAMLCLPQLQLLLLLFQVDRGRRVEFLSLKKVKEEGEVERIIRPVYQTSAQPNDGDSGVIGLACPHAVPCKIEKRTRGQRDPT